MRRGSVLCLLVAALLAALAWGGPAGAQGSASSGAQGRAPSNARLGAQGSASPGAQASIIGGRSVAIAQFPWLAFVNAVESDEEAFGCTGSVVAPRVILTAGHCLYDLETQNLVPPSQYTVTTGVASVRSARAGNTSLVATTVLSPAFSPTTLRSDAGLLILREPVAVPPLPLATPEDQGLLARGTPISIVGWGETASPSTRVPPLQASASVIQAPAYCQRQVSEFTPYFASALQFCAVNPPSYATGLCHGDSGSPAIAHTPDGAPIQVGIGSQGEPRCSTLLPNVFTRADFVQPWVQSWIAAVESGEPRAGERQPRLPFLTLARARRFVVESLTQDFADRYRGGAEKRTNCRRIARPRVKCEVRWSRFGNDYYGTITVYYLFRPDSLFWSNRYRINWASRRCLSHAGRERSCVIRTQTR